MLIKSFWISWVGYITIPQCPPHVLTNISVKHKILRILNSVLVKECACDAQWGYRRVAMAERRNSDLTLAPTAIRENILKKNFQLFLRPNTPTRGLSKILKSML